MAKTSVYVGTSGWMYDWNEGGNLEWYVRHSGLNAVELNASFYRFPFRSQVERWAKRSGNIRWAVKVHRSITHYRKLSGQALDVWRKFKSLFDVLESKETLDFYLLQMPPSFSRTQSSISKLSSFVKLSGVEPRRLAFEFRHESWFSEDTVDLAKKLGITLVSVDSPMTSWFVSVNDTVYLRMHGRSAWYAHNYSEEELKDVAKRLLELNPKRIYVFFNNNHWMLGNARYMLKLLTEGIRA